MDISSFIFLTVIGLTQSKELSCGTIREFVDGHNQLRLKLARGEVPGQPPAADMKLMVWDNELAAKADYWASKLPSQSFDHNPSTTVDSKRFSTGENLYSIRFRGELQLDIFSALEAWFNEYKYYSFGTLQISDFNNDKEAIGHYTQMAWADSVFLGCGISKGSKNRFNSYYIVCNYGPAGNVVGMAPYKSSRQGTRKLICVTGDCRQMYGSKC